MGSADTGGSSHTKYQIKLGVGALALILVGALSSATSFARQLQLSNTVPQAQSTVLARDLSQDLTLSDDETTKQVMEISNLNSDTLKAWLLERVGYIVGESETDSDRLVAIQKYQYQNPGIFPDFESPNSRAEKDRSRARPVAGSGGRVTVVMANVGTTFYYRGKAQNVLVGYKFTSNRGNQVVAMTSPRVGIIKIGQGLFSIIPDRANPTSIVNTWFRLATLFHEAHHSDGNGKSLGFPHAVCPQGSKYYNYNACDREGNGPYAVGAYILKQARVTCQQNNTCSAGEAEMLANLALDSYSRLLAKNFIDPRPEGVVESGAAGGTTAP